MLKKYIGFQVGLFVLLMISADLRYAKADGLPPEEALPTQTAEQEQEAEEVVSSPSPESEEISSEPVVEKAPEAPSPKPSAPPALLPQKKETAQVKLENPSPAGVAAVPSEADLWSSMFHGTILSEPKPDGEIVGSKDQKMMMGQGDIVYLTSFKNELVPGKEWIVYKVIKNVYHPKTGRYVGDLVDVTGIVKITEVNKKIATAEIIRSRDPIFLNDQLALVETLFDLSSPSKRSLPEGLTATIVEARESRLNNATDDIVYIDRGKKDGVLRGDHFNVIRGGEEVGIRSEGEMLHFPEREVGNIVILSSQDHTATGRIVKSAEPISKGNPLLFHFLK